VSFALGLYLGVKNQFFARNPNPLVIPSLLLCLLGIILTSIFAAKYNVIDSEARHSRSTSMAQEANRFRYAVQTIDTAKSIILTPEGETTTDERWANETMGVLELI